MDKLFKAAARWKIPIETAKIVADRDQKCVYCKCVFDDDVRSKKASWEHIVNDIRINGPENIALCCVGCNASKGAKELDKWLMSDNAKKRGAEFPEFLKKDKYE